jgi:ABC-2 type transport system permease protein
MTRTLEIIRIFALKDLRVALTYRLSFALGIVVTFYGLLSFFFISRVIGHSAKVGTPDEYFRFIVVGVALSNLLRASVTTAASNVRRDQLEGTLEMLATQPLAPVPLALGWSALPVIEATIEGMITMLVAIPLGFSGFSPDWMSVLAVLVVSIVVFLAIGFLGAALVLAIQQGTGIMGLVTAGLALTSGSLFPVSVLPHSVRWISDVSPLTYALRAMREAILEGRGIPSLLSGSLGVLLIYGAVLLPLSIAVLVGSFSFARARGTLARF